MQFDGNEYDPPRVDELEVSIFGPGYGECIVVHVGGGHWLTIDSCKGLGLKEPVALAYLQTLQVDVAEAVKAVIASHWDDDHVNGLAEVYAAAESAKFVCSPTMISNEFKSLLSTWGLGSLLPFGSGVDEFSQVLKILKRRAGDARYPSPVLAGSNKRVWWRTEQPQVEVLSLSPSDSASLAASARLSQIVAESDGLRRRIPRIEDNHSSVVISIRVADTAVLLGGDLQIRADRTQGWNAVIDTHDGRVHEPYKIAHHGSENGDCDEIWAKLLKPTPLVVTTPYVRGHLRLPKITDCDRILTRTSRSFLTAPPIPGRVRIDDKTAEKTMREAALNLQSVPGRFGHVRIRRTLASDQEWIVTTFGDALDMGRFVLESRN